MRQFLKYGSLSLAILVSLLAITALLLPTLVNVQQYVPEIEKKIFQVSGRRLALGHDLKFSIFPWLTLSCSNIRLGNPPGFGPGQFLAIDSFEAGLKLLPLLKRQIKISRFTVKGLEINLEKRLDGRGNWLPGSLVDRGGDNVPWWPAETGRLLVEQLAVPRISISDSRVSWNDRSSGKRYEITDVTVNFYDITLNKPFPVDFLGTANGRPIRFEGRVGPLGRLFERDTLDVDLKFSLSDNVRALLKGQFKGGDETVNYDLDLEIAPFSPKMVWADISGDVSVITAYPLALNTMAVSARVKGTGDSISFEEGAAELDDSHIDFNCQFKGGADPTLQFSVNADSIDLSRYVRQQGDSSPVSGGKGRMINAADARFPSPEIGIEGSVRAGEVLLYGGKFSDVVILLTGKNGSYTADPVSFSFYRGEVLSKITFDTAHIPFSGSLDLHGEDVDISLMMQDFFDTDLLGGRMNTDINVSATGDTLQSVIKSFNGAGRVQLSDGMISGYELVTAGHQVSNGIAEPGTGKMGRGLYFTELTGSATVKNGVVEILRAEMNSPAAEISLEGLVDLVTQRIDLRMTALKSIFVKSNKKGEHYLMPLTLTGTFSDMQFSGAEASVNGEQKGFAEEIDVRKLVDDTLPAPVGEDVGHLVGKALVDPAVVAQRFGLHPGLIRRTKVKKEFRQGTGKVRISPLRKRDYLIRE